MAKPIEKLMSVPEAVRQLVNDGDHLIIGNYTVCTCMELVFEILRQGKKGFTLYSQSGILDVEMLVAGGAVERLVTTYVLRSGGRRGGEFVEKLDYFTSPGYLDGGDARQRSGLFPPDSGPSRLISQKGIFEFDPETKEWYLAKIHPRITVDDIKKDVPWDLKISQNLTVTEKPSAEEIGFIRKFAPAAAMGRALVTEMGFANLTRELEARGKLQIED